MQTIFPAAYQSQVASSAWHPKNTQNSLSDKGCIELKWLIADVKPKVRNENCDVWGAISYVSD